MKWSQEETLKFVELYRDHECLWNMSSMAYRNKNKRQKAMETIIQEMGKDGFGMAEAKQKVKNLRSTYNQELTKIRKSKKSGCSPSDAYVPSIKWFNVLDAVMTICKGSSQINVDTQEIEGLKKEDEDTVEEPSLVSRLEATNSPTACCSKTQVPIPQQVPAGTAMPGAAMYHNTRETPTNTGKSKSTKRHFQEVSPAVAELCNMNQILSQHKQQMLENEAFGKYVVLALDQLPLDHAVMAQNEIQSVLTQYRLAALSTTLNQTTSPNNMLYSAVQSPSPESMIPNNSPYISPSSHLEPILTTHVEVASQL